MRTRLRWRVRLLGRIATGGWCECGDVMTLLAVPVPEALCCKRAHPPLSVARGLRSLVDVWTRSRRSACPPSMPMRTVALCTALVRQISAKAYGAARDTNMTKDEAKWVAYKLYRHVSRTG